MQQVSTLLGEDWIGSAAFRALPAIICGDLSAVGSSSAYRRMAQHFQDAQLLAGRKPRPTFPSRFPVLRLDHIFVSEGFGVTAAEIPTNPLTRQASDHLPLTVELNLHGSQSGARSPHSSNHPLPPDARTDIAALPADFRALESHRGPM